MARFCCDLTGYYPYSYKKMILQNIVQDFGQDFKRFLAKILWRSCRNKYPRSWQELDKILQYFIHILIKKWLYKILCKILDSIFKGLLSKFLELLAENLLKLDSHLSKKIFNSIQWKKNFWFNKNLSISRYLNFCLDFSVM